VDAREALSRQHSEREQDLFGPRTHPSENRARVGHPQVSYCPPAAYPESRILSIFAHVLGIQPPQLFRVVSTGILPSKLTVVVFAVLEPPVDSIAEPEFMYPRTPGLKPLCSTVPKRRPIPQSGTTVLDTATLVPLITKGLIKVSQGSTTTGFTGLNNL
jgi:hypothetical protein